MNGKNIAQEGKDGVQIRSYFILGLRRASHVFTWFLFSFVKTDITIRGWGGGLVEKRRLSVDLAVGEPQFTFCPIQQLFSAIYFLRGRVNLPLGKSEKATYSLPQVSVSRYERVTQI